MYATWYVEFRTGADLSDNDRYRIRELIAEAVSPVADEYLARQEVRISHFVPGPIYPQEEQCNTIPASAASIPAAAHATITRDADSRYL